MVNKRSITEYLTHHNRSISLTTVQDIAMKSEQPRVGSLKNNRRLWQEITWCGKDENECSLCSLKFYIEILKVLTFEDGCLLGCCLHHSSDDGGRKCLWIVSEVLQDYKTLQPRRQLHTYIREKLKSLVFTFDLSRVLKYYFNFFLNIVIITAL